MENSSFRQVNESVVKIDREILGGTPCFAGTRVPIGTLLNYLEPGTPLDEFFEDFPSVTRQQVDQLIEEVASDRELLRERLAEHLTDPEGGTRWVQLRDRLFSSGSGAA